MKAIKDAYAPSSLTLYNDDGYYNSATLVAGDVSINVVDDESAKSDERVTILFNHSDEKSPSLVLSRYDEFEGRIDTSFAISDVDRATINGKEIATEEYVDNAIENIPAQVQADWKQTDETSKAYILNKPSINEDENKNIIEGNTNSVTTGSYDLTYIINELDLGSNHYINYDHTSYGS